MRTAIPVLCLTMTAAAAFAGDLNPPPGPVAPTHKTLTDVEPRTAVNSANTPGDAGSTFRITQPGSYYLTGNINGEPGKHGILITSANVTLDLNGFALIGDAASLDGVNGSSNVTVRNGTVRNWRYGVQLSSRSRVEHVTASFNTVAGLRANGADFLITGCVVSANTGTGIVTACCGQIVGSEVGNNTQGGINVGTSVTITGCTITDNDTFGVLLTGDSVISGCTVTFNGTDGIVVGSGCLVLNNQCSANGLLGSSANIRVNSIANRIEGNNCRIADVGIDVNAAGNIIIRNTCSGNTTNWDIAANNVVGPIIDRTAPASAAILGNSAPDSTGSTHPNANFTY